MKTGTAFVDVRRLQVDYTVNASMLGRLAGHRATAVTALRDVSFQLNIGAWVTLFGAPAAGKSTLLRVLAGGYPATSGKLLVNGKNPMQVPHSASGYVSLETGEENSDTVSDVLQTFAAAHTVPHAPQRLAAVSDSLAISSLLFRPANTLSATESLRIRMAKAALSDSPLVLLDDCADMLTPAEITSTIQTLFAGRTGIVATRSTATAEALGLPLLLLHQARLVHFGSPEDIALATSVPRIVDVWLEGVRYDLLRQLRRHPGVSEVRLVPSDQYAGQRLRIHLRSSRYLPSLYDIVSQAQLLKIEELPPSLADILAKL